MNPLKALNAGLAFALELAMLAALGYWGYKFGGALWLKWLLAIALPVLAATGWGLFFAPRATQRLPIRPGALLSLGLFLLSAVALYFANQAGLALVLALIAIANRILVLLWRQW